jgi:hypothetical protein
MLREKGSEYVLPVKVDNTELPGLMITTGYLTLGMGVDKISALLIEKLRHV